MIRLFAALAVPSHIGEGLARHQIGLPGARWRTLDQLHVTLRFFGELREDVARDLEDALADVGGEPLDLTLESVGAFGEGADIHAIWAGVAENPGLRRLAARCESAARRTGLKPDTRNYHPHVTLAYLNRPDPAAVGAWIQQHSLLKSPPFRIEAFGLYSSHLSKGGSIYRVEAEYPLA